jgi:hypothetical protein
VIELFFWHVSILDNVIISKQDRDNLLVITFLRGCIVKSKHRRRWICLGLRMSERWWLWDYKPIYFCIVPPMLSSVLTVVNWLLATLIVNSMFIWLFFFLNELPQLGFELETSRFISERVNPSSTVKLYVKGLKKTILF